MCACQYAEDFVFTVQVYFSLLSTGCDHTQGPARCVRHQLCSLRPGHGDHDCRTWKLITQYSTGRYRIWRLYLMQWLCVLSLVNTLIFFSWLAVSQTVLLPFFLSLRLASLCEIASYLVIHSRLVYCINLLLVGVDVTPTRQFSTLFSHHIEPSATSSLSFACASL